VATHTAEENKLPELKIDFENLEDRMVRLTIHSSRLGDAVLTNDGFKTILPERF